MRGSDAFIACRGGPFGTFSTSGYEVGKGLEKDYSEQELMNDKWREGLLGWRQKKRRLWGLKVDAFDPVHQMKWMADCLEQVDGKNDGMCVKRRGRWKRKGSQHDERVMEKRESWCAFLCYCARKRACAAKRTGARSNEP